MTSKHTPTPWNWHGPYMTGAYKVSAMDGEDKLALRLYIEPSINAKNDALHIVRCVNAHDDLVAALRKLTTLAANVCSQTNGIGVINAVAELRPAIPEMRAALAKVQS